MKYLILVIFVIGIYNSVNAQSERGVRAAAHRHMLHILQQAGSRPDAARVTSGIPARRVIAQSTRDNTAGTLSDSVNLKYSAFHGSTYDFGFMQYAYNYPYFTSPMFNYAGLFTKPSVLFDTFRHWTIDANTNVYGFYEADYGGYNSTSDLTSYRELYTDSSINPNMSFANRFNSAHNIDSAFAYNLMAGVADSAFRQFFSYNTSGLLTKDSTYEYHSGVWHIVSRTLYTYSGANDLIQIDNYSNNTDTSFTLPLVEQVQYINTYDASHRLLTVASSFYAGTTLSPYIRDTFSYTGTALWHTGWKEYQYDPINGYWAPSFNMTKLLNVSGFPDTVLFQGYDSLLANWVPQTMYTVKYNVSADPDTLNEFDYNFTTFPSTPNYTTTYYYQTYYITIGVPGLSAPDFSPTVYPNPFADQLNIVLPPTLQSSQLTAVLSGIDGSIVARRSMQATPTCTFSIASVAPGLYWLTLIGPDGQQVFCTKVVKKD